MRQSSKKIINQDQNLQQIDQKNQEIRQEISNLETKITSVTSDFSKERRLRDELLLQKPGEYIVLLDEIKSEEPVVVLPQQTKLSVWDQWRAVLWYSPEVSQW